MNISMIYYTINGIIILCLTIVLIFAIKAYNRKPTFGQAKVMGVNKRKFYWIQFIFILVLFEYVFSIFSYILDLSIWFDVILYLIPIILIIITYYMFSKHNKFRPALFASLVLVPLGIPGISFVAKLAKVGAVEITRKSGLYTGKTFSHEQYKLIKLPNKNVTKVIKNWPQNKQTMVGIVTFKNPKIKGTFGDHITAKQITAQPGYFKLSSKNNKIHGIDGVFKKTSDKGELLEILIVETKVDKSVLNKKTRQMSDEWVNKNVDKLLKSSDSESQKTGELLLRTIKNSPEKISKQLWTHDLSTGQTTIKILGKEAEVIKIERKFKGNAISDTLKQFCKNGRLDCILSNIEGKR